MFRLDDILNDEGNFYEENVVKLPIGKEVQAVISRTRDEIEAQIGDVELCISSPFDECCQFGIKLYIGDQVHILRT